MPSSPSKRRKISPTTSVAVGVDAPDSWSRSRTSTPSRSSYQSPTKASLSRSHPTILARSPGRRASEGRGKNLRQQTLQTSQTPEQNDDETSGAGGKPVPASSVSSADRPVATATRESTNYAGGPLLGRSPLRPRQPSTRGPDLNGANPGQNTTTSTRSMSATAMPRNQSVLTAQSYNAEPELPPTPTQLGLSPKPDRPRGISASSSPSSRGSRRSRLRNGQSDSTSPLKPKDKPPPSRTEELSRFETEAQPAEEAPESDVEQGEHGPDVQAEAVDTINDYETPQGVATKRKLRDSLAAQLKRLQAETVRLESALDREDDGDEDLDPQFLALLSTRNVSCDPWFTDTAVRSSTTTLKDPVALDLNPLTFLKAFAPGDLRLTTTTKSSSMRGKLHQAHVLNISAPPPWPLHVFNAMFRVTCDVETQRVISITGASIRPRHGAGIKELRHWIEARLKNPLHKFDAGTLIWGLGMWWKEAVVRAQFFHHVDVTKAGNKNIDARTLYQQNVVKAADVQSLLPYLGKSFVELIPAEPYSNRASTNEARKYRQPRLLLKWDLELDWAGEVRTEIDVAGTKVSAKGQEGAKQVFRELTRRKGLDRAVGEIVQVCGGGGGRKRK
jgi:hypothetical protein